MGRRPRDTGRRVVISGTALSSVVDGVRVTVCGRRPREPVDRRVVTGGDCVVDAPSDAVVLPSFSISEFTRPGKLDPFDTSHRDDGVSFDGT